MFKKERAKVSPVHQSADPVANPGPHLGTAEPRGPKSLRRFREASVKPLDCSRHVDADE